MISRNALASIVQLTASHSSHIHNWLVLITAQGPADCVFVAILMDTVALNVCGRVTLTYRFCTPPVLLLYKYCCLV